MLTLLLLLGSDLAQLIYHCIVESLISSTSPHSTLPLSLSLSLSWPAIIFHFLAFFFLSSLGISCTDALDHCKVLPGTPLASSLLACGNNN
jgi:hypothetical protein